MRRNNKIKLLKIGASLMRFRYWKTWGEEGRTALSEKGQCWIGVSCEFYLYVQTNILPKPRKIYPNSARRAWFIFQEKKSIVIALKLRCFVTILNLG